MNLIELIESDFEILEDKRTSSGDVMRAAVVWQRADVVNSNKRLYPRSVLESALQKIQPQIAAKSVFGAAYHPQGADCRVTDVSHMFESARIESDGTATGVIRILPTKVGQDVMTILRCGGKIGLSSRGTGTTTRKSDMNRGEYDEVSSDFVLRSPADFCLSPSVGEAGIKKFLESAYNRSEELTEQDLRGIFYEWCRAGYRGNWDSFLRFQNAKRRT